MTSGDSTNTTGGNDNNNNLVGAFRDKVKLMQTWKPGSTPSNRDRLELYAYHKVAVSGDAPTSLSNSANAAERAKYQAWRSKSGKSQEDSMRLYLQEADRQLRVYGSAAVPIPHDNTNTNTNTTNQESMSPNINSRTPQTTPANSNVGESSSVSNTPRGIAAIPLLCAAVAESRKSYLRRLGQTSIETAWWKRQESLCAPPGSLTALPESFLLSIARFIEHITLTPPGGPGVGGAMIGTGGGVNVRNLIASFCWPLHKCLLVCWMLIILYITTIRSVLNTCGIIVWGSRRTGLSLNREWIEIFPLVGHSIQIMCESHQPLTCRLVGLILLPFSSLVSFINRTITNITLASSSMILILCVTWWYWLLTVPFLMGSLLCTAFSVGFCFVLIEFAGV
jgi:acyl-CoA-binding protein